MTAGATGLRVDGALRPLAVDRGRPRLDWDWTEGDGIDTFRVELSDGAGRSWESEWSRPGPAFLDYAGPTLLPHTTHSWRLAFRGHGGRRWTTDDAQFVTGLCGRPWSAAWISTAQEARLGGLDPVGPRRVEEPPDASRPQRPAPLFSVDFDASPVPGDLYLLRATALGVLDITLNGLPVSAECLAPGWTDVARTLQYQTLDVTDLLRPGANRLEIRVTDGWAVGHICWFGTAHYSPIRAVLAQVEALRDGGRDVIAGTGPHWSARESSLTYADLQNGCDTRVAADPGAPLDVIEVAPTVGECVAGVAPPVVPIGRFPARSGSWVGDEYVVDFGQNMVGWVELDLWEHDGQAITVRHAEVLTADGALYTDSLRSAAATDGYTFAGPVGRTKLAPTGTVHGFRYAGITGLAGADLTGLEAVAVSADLAPLAGFRCSDPHLTRLHDNVLWSARANLLSVPTDCPQRDERLGWTGDAQIFAATAALNFRALEFFRKWLRDVRDAITADGSVPNVAPDVLTTSLAGSHDGAAGWGDAIVIVPWEMYQAYGDRSILVENLDAMAGWLAYLERNSEGLIRPAEGFGDWLAFDPTPLDLVATAFYHRAALLASRCAAAVDDERADGWDALAGRVRDAWRERFLRDGLPSARTQGAAVLALHFGLLDDHEIPAVAADLAALLEENQFRLSTGFLTTPYLLPALTQVGRDDVALRVLLGDAPPSWLYPVKHGDATSMWERWDSWTEEGGFQDPAMNSFNHYAYGAVDEWICDRIGGIRRTGPAYASVEISPLPSREITSASHARTTPYGRIAVEWETDGDELRIRTEIPDGVIPTFVTPAGYAAPESQPYMLPSGRSTLLLRRTP